MPLPRYSEKNIAQTNGGGIVESQRSQIYGNLMSKIEAFKTPIMQSLTTSAKLSATQDADNAFMKGGSHQRLIDDNTIYASTYNERLNGLNKNTKILKADEASNLFYEQNKNNPTGYAANFDSMSQTIMEDTSDANRAEVSIRLSSMKSNHLATINKTVVKEMQEKQAAVNAGINTKNSRDIEASSYDNNHTQTNALMATYTTELNRQLSTGEISPKDYNAEVNKTKLKSIFSLKQGINDRLIDSSNFEEAQANIDKLKTTTASDYDNDYRDNMAARLQSRLNISMQDVKSQKSAVDKQLSMDVTEAVKIFENAKTPKNALDLVGRVKGTQYEKKLYDSIKIHDSIAPFLSMPPKDKVIKINELQDLSNKKETSDIQETTLAFLKKSYTQDMEGLKKSPLEVAINRGYIDPLKQIDFYTSPANLTASLQDRVKNIDKTNNIYQVHAGALLPSEMDYLEGAFSTMTSNNKISVLESINSLPPKTASATFQQLNSKGWGEYSVIGNLATEHRDTAKILLHGYKIKSQTDYIKPKLLKTNFQEAVGKVFGDSAANVDIRNSTYDAIESAYATLATDEDSKLEVDSDLYEKAVTMVTGGVFKVGNADSSIIAPVYGMQQNKFEKWFDNVGEEQFLNIENRMKSDVSLEDYIDDLKNECTVVNIKNGTYGFKDKYGKIKVDSTGNPVLLQYNEAYDEPN